MERNSNRPKDAQRVSLGCAQGEVAPAQARRASRARAKDREAKERDPLIRAENEDDDGYDPYSDRTAGPEPLFERDPWD